MVDWNRSISRWTLFPKDWLIHVFADSGVGGAVLAIRRFRAMPSTTRLFIRFASRASHDLLQGCDYTLVMLSTLRSDCGPKMWCGFHGRLASRQGQPTISRWVPKRWKHDDKLQWNATDWNKNGLMKIWDRCMEGNEWLLLFCNFFFFGFVKQFPEELFIFFG